MTPESQPPEESASFFQSPFFSFLLREIDELKRRALWCLGSLAAVSCLLIGLPHWEHSYVMDLSAWVQRLALPPGINLVFLDPLEPMVLMFKVSLVVAVALCLPLVAYHFVAFTSPALDRGYRGYYVGFIFTAIGLFALGLFLTGRFFLPLTVRMLIDYGLAAGGTPQITFDKFYTFVFLFLLVFSLPFETPLVMGFLHHFNLVPAKTFKTARFKVYGVLLILSQLVTPDPIVTPLMFTGMTILLYETGILACKWL